MTSITDSLGTHLTYAKKLDSQGIGAQGDSEFWLANVPSTAPGSMTVTATFTAGNNCSVICILVLTGAAPVAGQAGATAKASWNTGGSTTITLTTLKDHSWVFAFTTNANTNTAPTFPGGQTDVFNGHTMLGQHPGAGFECWLHGFTTPTSPAGATSQSVTGTGSAFGSQVAIEVQAAAVAAQNLAPTGIASAQAFGTAVIVARPPPQGVSPAGIASTQAFGTPALAIHLGLHPPGIASAEAFGKSRVQRKRTTTAVLVPAGIVSAQAVGRPTVHPGAVTLSPVGIASAEAVGLGGIGRPFILPKVTGAANLPVMLVRRSGLRH